MNFSTKIIEKVVEHFSQLPGIGKKTALRFTFHLLKMPKEKIKKFAESLIELAEKMNFCKICFNISSDETCNICQSHKRDKSIICVVEDFRDIISIENTNIYNGEYHVLGGIISPLDGISPKDLNINELINRLQKSNIKEVILALSPTMEGDTTNYYLYKKIEDFEVKITSIAKGIAIGNQLEYTDQVTLAKSISNRVLFGKNNS
tara:strand:- start:936 stop:1550 length:615 start_codon:yes stop_codon:yes gene_type:complete